MKKNNLLFLIIFTFFNASAQEKKENNLGLIQGIWENIMNTEAEHSYKVIKGINSLGISHNDDPNNLDFYMLECLEGFQNYKYDDVDSINVCLLKGNGKYFTTILDKKYIKNGWVKMQYCIVPEYFECNGANMSINGGQLAEFVKIGQLPNNTLKLLYKRGKKDKRDYIKDYLDIKVAEITPAKCTVNSLPDKPTTIQLSKGDLVTVLEEKGNWLKVDYGMDNPGWVKKEDTK
jgi:hypothetical protein